MKYTVIAEIGHNFMGDIDLAKDLISLAKDNGATCAKFQLYDIDTIKKPGDTNYEELKAAQLSYDDMRRLFEYGQSINYEIFFSVFSDERLEWLSELPVNKIKIAQRTALNERFVQRVLKEGKHTFISGRPRSYGSKTKQDFLYCKSRREILQEGIYFLPVLSDRLREYSGFSDHTIGMEWAETALLRNGYTILEKHFTINKNWPGWDQPASMTPAELYAFTEKLKRASDAEEN